jgi:hypothetical protein
MSESTAVTHTPFGASLRAEAEARIAENKAKNRMATAIRGTIWSKDLSAEGVYALAEYCRQNNLDPLRHIEVLGGKPYLTATLFEERAAPLIQSGALVPHEPEFINADPRLDQLAVSGDAWAIDESTRRMRARIMHGVPEKAAAAVVYRITVSATGQTVVGVNWCGGGVRQRDPVGDNEPTKTAITRAGRRAWKQVAEVVPTFGAHFAALEQAATETGRVIVADAEQELARTPQLVSGSTRGSVVNPDAYGHGDEMPTPEQAVANARRALAAPDPYAIEDNAA